MPKFTIRAHTIGCYNEEIEAESLDKAQEIFTQKQDAGDYEFEEALFLEGDEGFDVIEELVSSEE